jgi:isoleucyl-tRNA synthetase
MRDFIDDLSTWYVRFARDRVKSTDETEKQQILYTLRYILLEFSKVIAPVMPFVAEEVFQVVRVADDVESVHLSEWPKAGSIDEKLISEMTNVRTLVSEALKLRQEAGVIVRQPLASLSVSEQLSPEMEELVRKEVNVKEVVTSTAEMIGTARIILNTELTPKLIREGDVRKFMRSLAEARKEKGLMQRDTVLLVVEENGRAVLESEALSGVSCVTFGTVADGFKAELSSGPVSFSFTTDAA